MRNIFRNKSNWVVFSFLFLSFGFTKTTNYEKDANSINFTFGKAKLKIIVCDENIMQVKYTLADAFSTKENLIAADKIWPKTPFEVTENNQDVIISTKKLKAKVNKVTGVVVFYDQNDNLPSNNNLNLLWMKLSMVRGNIRTGC